MQGGLTTADGTPLKIKLKRTQRRRQWVAVGLVAPLFLFMVVVFAVPIVVVLMESVDNPEVVEGLPRTTKEIQGWDGKDLPAEPVFAALAEDLRTANQDRGLIGRLGKRLNFEIGGFRSMIFRSAQRIAEVQTGPYKEAFLQINPNWGNRDYWAAIKRNASPLTDHYMLAAIDRQRNADGDIVRIRADEAIFIDMFLRTFWISLLVTLGCLVLGYPVAFLLATVPTRISNLLMFFVLLPFWTALLVRTTAWIVLLQREGLINGFLRRLNIIDQPIPLIFNRTGVLVAMIHVLLPFMILPLYSVMKGIDPQHMRAAKSLGAHPLIAFWRVYFPQTLPGTSAGCVLVFIIAVGYYVTPTLVGGAKDQMVSTFIALYTNTILNWGQASALGAILLLIVVVLYSVYHRLIGGELKTLR